MTNVTCGLFIIVLLSSLSIGPVLAQDACSGERGEQNPEYTSPPLLRNPMGMRQALTTEVARLDTLPSEGGRVFVAFLIDSDGTVREMRLASSTGSSVSDSIAIRTARYARFYPAYLDRDPICIWMAFPFVVPPTGSSGRGALSSEMGVMR